MLDWQFAEWDGRAAAQILFMAEVIVDVISTRLVIP